VQRDFPGLRAARHAVAVALLRAQRRKGLVNELAVTAEGRRPQRVGQHGRGQAVGMVLPVGSAVIRPPARGVVAQDFFRAQPLQ